MREELKTFVKLINDLEAFKSNEKLILTNQEGDLFQKNSFQKKGWKYYINGGKISLNTKNYLASYTFDFGVKFNPLGNILEFTSFTQIAGLNLLDFITQVINADYKKFVWLNGLQVLDTRKELFKRRKIKILHTLVDAMLLKVIVRYFKEIEEVEFSDCTILQSCNFSDVSNLKITIKNCVINNFNVFALSNNDYSIENSKVLSVAPSKILSSKINISDTKINFKELFLKCNFENLIDLWIDSKFIDSYYGNDFLFLGYSAPNIQKLRIVGIFDNVDFLSRLVFLTNISIVAIHDIQGLEYAHVVNKKIYNKYKKRHNEQVEIDKILYYNLDEKYFVSQKEVEAQVRLANFNRTLAFTKKEETALKEYFLKGDRYFDLDFSKVEIGHYITDYNCLYFKTQEPYNWLEKNRNYHFFRNYLYSCESSNDKKEVVHGKKFVTYVDGYPIILERKYYKWITTIEDAKRKVGENPIKFDLEKEEFNKILRVIKELAISVYVKTESLDSFCEGVEIASDCVSVKTTSKKVIDYLKSQKLLLAYKLEKDILQNKTLKDLKTKNQLAYVNLIKQIKISYNLLSLKQKEYLICQIVKHFKERLIIGFKDNVVDSQNFNNYLITKYLNILKETGIQIDKFYRYKEKLYLTELELKQLKQLVLPK